MQSKDTPDGDGSPVVIPTIHWREGDELYFHGSAASRMLRSLKEGVDACVTVTLVDGLVLARSAFHHSMNYRSAIVYGTLQAAPDKERALEIFTEKLVPGRWDPDLPLKPTDRAFSSDWTAVDFG